MSFDTQALNRGRQNLQDFEELWIFGYGSLIYKVDFDFLKSAPANIIGYERRLWQGSSDHRGTVQNPGRVVTLIPVKDAVCFGIAYQVNAHVFRHLDHREKNGYLREKIDIEFLSGETVKGLVYMATSDNDAFLGHADDKVLAEHINQSSGPSGDNKDYVYQLADSLRYHDVHDKHIFDIEAALIQINKL